MKRSRKSSNSPVDLALARFAEGFNCSQSVFSAFSRGKKISTSSVLSIASPFGAGIGRTAGTCGAVTGAVMVIGLHHGHVRAKDLEEKEAVYHMTAELVERFHARNGSIICKGLLGCDLSTPEGSRTAKTNDYHHTRCPKFVRDAAEIVVGLKGHRERLTQ